MSSQLQNDCSLVLEFLEKLDGPEFVASMVNITRANSTACCSFYENIKCENDAVTELNFGKSGIIGRVSDSVGKLKSLKRLSMSTNSLYGSLPELTQISTLEYIGFSKNNLTGDIPEQYGFLTKLTYLGVSNNQISGTLAPELGNLLNLVRFYVQNNKLSGVIPESFGKMRSLLEVDISGNQLNGSIPDEWNQLSLARCEMGADVCSNQKSWPAACGATRKCDNGSANVPLVIGLSIGGFILLCGLLISTFLVYKSKKNKKLNQYADYSESKTSEWVPVNMVPVQHGQYFQAEYVDDPNHVHQTYVMYQDPVAQQQASEQGTFTATEEIGFDTTPNSSFQVEGSRFTPNE